MKKLYRSRDNQMLGGVCMGLARYFDVDVTLVRLIWVVFGLMGGSGVPAYIIAWIVIPEEPAGADEVIDVSDKSSSTGVSADNKTIGLIIVVIGAYLLMRNFFDVQIFRYFFWPAALIALGLFIMFGGLRGDKR